MERSPHEKSLFKVIVAGTALSFGCMGAIIASMKDFLHGDAAFTFSYPTVVGFVIGLVVGWLPWKFVGHRIERSRLKDGEKGSPERRP
jgi:hypothetical protein